MKLSLNPVNWTCWKAAFAGCAVLIAVAGCGTKDADSPATAGAPVGAPPAPGAPPGLKRVNSDEMFKPAVAKARLTVNQFIAALKKPKPGQKEFAFKMTLGGKEGVWLNNVAVKNGMIAGKMTQDSRTSPSIKRGSTQQVKPTQISDWMFIENGKLVGGYTIRLARDHMAPEQRKVFDKSQPFKF
jgi:uncharacterized protein YegJ (DUF2314 family)